MSPIIRILWLWLLLAATGSCTVAQEPSNTDSDFRLLSWNISGDAFVDHPGEFQALLRRADADILLLDEVRPAADAGQLGDVLAGLQPGQATNWRIDYGTSGGRQRGVIASRMPVESLPEFSKIIAYPEDARHHILQAMSARERADSDLSMEFGIPVNGAVVRIAGHRLLAVVADLQCCGQGPDSWQEFRRRVEAREIRQLIRQVLDRISVDGVILAGDFNLVNSSFPLALLTGPYPPPHSGLIPVEIYHLDGSSAWTWDGRGTPFPSGTLDFQLYGPQALQVRKGLVLDTEDLTAEELVLSGFESETTRRLSRHRPLVVEYELH